MSELRHGNRPVNTVFDLRDHNENQMTFALAWGMSHSDRLLKTVLGSPVVFDPKDAVITVQRVHDPRITDIEVVVPGRVHVVFEAKPGWRVPGQDQLERYVPPPDSGAADRRLVVLTQWGADDYAAKRIIGNHLSVPVSI